MGKLFAKTLAYSICVHNILLLLLVVNISIFFQLYIHILCILKTMWVGSITRNKQIHHPLSVGMVSRALVFYMSCLFLLKNGLPFIWNDMKLPLPPATRCDIWAAPPGRPGEIERDLFETNG